MTLSNLGFEDAGAQPGIPDAWSVSITTAAELVADWGSGSPPLDEESFEEEWDNTGYLFAFDTGDTSPTLLDTDVSEGEAIEDFEEGWDDNEAYIFELGGSSEAVFDSALTPEAIEDFEEGWDSNEDYETTLGASTAAVFDSALTPEAIEDFEEGWDGNENYLTTLSSSTAASFDGPAPEAFEDFEETFQEIQVVVDPATDLFTATGHGLVAGRRCSFRLGTAGALPAGVNSVFTYFVIASGLTANDFRVSTTSGGTTIDVTDAGAGTFYVRGDPTRTWILPA